DKGIDEYHMFNTFNMGIGMVLAVDSSIKDDVISELKALGEDAYEMGIVQAGGGGVCLI
ncbi:MAG TPA: phosphoribosylformylglycinamidine cyclo-ligase, partial [Clostridium sp.]|nr:phosphoribosylformylglycinamidine cyclo-ligase [Clostridium sp.]